MAAKSPEQLHSLFTTRFNNSDLDGLLELYEEDAVLLTMNGECRGKPGIREQIQGLLAAGLPIHLDTRIATAAGGVALLSADWRIEGVGAGKTAEVARQGADGLWRYIVDHPWGL
ncbi:MAG: DUF4440 domain-containing protein [Bryobacterales bacterium]|nr:DUF4440 domain-containing protein [Bryobacterales bacterium]